MLKVVIVGAGIAGLSAAISLRRAGHMVHVFERSSMNNEIGAAIHVPPNAARFLTAWGIKPDEWRWVQSRRTTYNDPFTLGITADLANETTASKIGGTHLFFSHRVDLHSSLKWMATREDGPGVPVTVHLKSNVVLFDPDTPSITLANGEVITGDLVVGADGVHSLAVETIVGRKNEPVQPEHSNIAFRFLIPAADLEADPETRVFNEDRDGWMRLFIDNEKSRRLVVYPCRDNEILNFVGIMYEEDAKYETKEDWQAGADVDHLVGKFQGWNPQLLKVVSKATDIKRWPLLYRAPLPSWCKGRMTLVGDSANPMLPHQGQGGAQGLESGLVLGLALHGCSSSPDEIEQRLAIYEKVRRNRASVIQILSNVGQDQSHMVREELKQYMPEDQIPKTPADNFQHNYGYDVASETLRAIREYNPSFELPQDFFVDEVVGVPGRQSEPMLKARGTAHANYEPARL